MNILRLEQTIFTVRHKGKPCYRLELEIENVNSALCEVTLQSEGWVDRATIQLHENKQIYHLHVPVSAEPYTLRVELRLPNDMILQESCHVKPRKEWEVSFVPLSHHDYGYTEVIDRLREHFCAYYEDVLDFCARTDGYPEEAKYRYTVECTWSLLYWLEKCSERSKDRFFDYVRSGRIDIMAFYAHIADVNCTSEELIRLMYPTFELERKYGIQVESAAFVDMPGLSWGVPKVLHAAGVKYFFAGMPAYFEWSDFCGIHDTPVVHSFWDESAIMPNGRPLAFHWEAQDNASVLAYYQGSYGWFLGHTTMETEVPNYIEEVEAHLPKVIRDLENRNVQHNIIRFIDHGVDNYPPQISISNIVKKWNEKYLSPKLCVDTNTGFFRKLERMGVEFPTYRGEVPHTDYNVETLSFIKEQSVNNITHMQVQSAEAVATLHSVLDNYQSRQNDISKIYQDMMLFDEHCAGMARPFGRVYDWNWSCKSHHAYRASGMADEVLSESVYSMAGKIKGEQGTKIVTVFNPTSSAKTDIVTVANFPLGEGEYRLEDMSNGERISGYTQVIDDPYLPVPFAAHRYSMYQMGKPEVTYATELQFVAKDIPAYGYKSYVLSQVTSDVCHSNAAEGLTIENEYYCIKADPIKGVLCSVWDKEEQREFVDHSAKYGFGEVVVRSVVSETVQPFTCKSVSIRSTGNIKQSIVVKGFTETCPQIMVEFTLYSGLKKVDVAVRVLKDTAPLVESFVVFPFAVDNPKLLYDGNNCIVQPFKDQLPGSNTNYYSVQDWAMVKNAEATAMIAPLETHIIEFGDLWHTYVSQAHHSVHPKAYGAPYVTENAVQKGQMAAMLFYSSARTNFSVTQHGDYLFRFSLLTGNSDMEYGNFRQTNALGLVPVIRDGNKRGTLPATCGMFTIREDNVRALACKLSEDVPDSMVIRLEERLGISGQATIENLIVPITKAELLNITEDLICTLPFDETSISVPINAYEVKTIRIYWKEVDPSRYGYGNDHTVEFRY